jgi:hypothetical protein
MSSPLSSLRGGFSICELVSNLWQRKCLAGTHVTLRIAVALWR